MRIWQIFLKDVKGCGEVLSGQLLALLDVTKADHISSFWKFCGIYPDGVRRIGEKIEYNPRAKTVVYKIAVNFLRNKSQYARFYRKAKPKEERKLEEQIKNGEVTIDGSKKMVVYYRSIRKMTKVFLAHLWLFLRKIESLPSGIPYIDVKEQGHRIVSWEEMKNWE